jgi:hypothetical protein
MISGEEHIFNDAFYYPFLTLVIIRKGLALQASYPVDPWIH